MYTIETLTELNPIFHNEHRVKQSDVDMANRYIEIIEKSRTDTEIQVGDIIEFTTKYGDYYVNAHVEKFETERNEWNICERGTPFILSSSAEDNISCSTSSGTWSYVPNSLKLVGKRKKIFKVMGNYIATPAHGSINIEATVNVWEYKEPEALYGDCSTKDYDKYYLSYCVDSRDSPKDGIYRYLGNNIAFITTADYKLWRDTFKGVEFNGYSENQKVIFMYKRIEKLIPEQEYNALDLPVDTRVLNGIVRVKVKYDDDNLKEPLPRV